MVRKSTKEEDWDTSEKANPKIYSKDIKKKFMWVFKNERTI